MIMQLVCSRHLYGVSVRSCISSLLGVAVVIASVGCDDSYGGVKQGNKNSDAVLSGARLEKPRYDVTVLQYELKDVKSRLQIVEHEEREAKQALSISQDQLSTARSRTAELEEQLRIALAEQPRTGGDPVEGYQLEAVQNQLEAVQNQLLTEREEASDLQRQIEQLQNRLEEDPMSIAPSWQMPSEDITSWLDSLRANVDQDTACPICFGEHALLIHGMCRCPGSNCSKIICQSCYRGCRGVGQQYCPYCRITPLAPPLRHDHEHTY